MKNILLPVLLPQVLLATVLSLIGMYFLGYFWMANGAYTALQASLLAILPGLIVFFATLTVGSRTYLLAAQPVAPTQASVPRKYVFVLLVLLTIGAAYVLDYCFFTLCDSSLSQAYADGMRVMLSGGTLVVSESQLGELARTPFFSQNLGVNCVFTVVGYLLAWPIASTLLKKPQLV